MLSAVYFIHTKDFSHYYIGSTGNTKKRFQHHIASIRSGRHENERVQRSFDKYGESNFIFSVAEEFNSRESASIAEHELLGFHFGKPGCLNFSSNGIMSAQCPNVIAKRNATLKSEKHRFDASLKAKNWRKENPKIALLNDKKRTEARTNSKSWLLENIRRGKERSSTPEAKAAFKKRIEKFYVNGGINGFSKAVIRISNDGTETNYISAAEAIRNNPGLHANSVSRCCKGIGKTASGFRWRFA